MDKLIASGEFKIDGEAMDKKLGIEKQNVFLHRVGIIFKIFLRPIFIVTVLLGVIALVFIFKYTYRYFDAFWTNVYMPDCESGCSMYKIRETIEVYSVCSTIGVFFSGIGLIIWWLVEGWELWDTYMKEWNTVPNSLSKKLEK